MNTTSYVTPGMSTTPGTDTTSSTVGVVGLGTMGSRIAARLLDAGHPVHATNRTRAKAQPLIGRGLVWQDTPRAVAAAADVVFSMVTDDAALAAITSGRTASSLGSPPGRTTST